MSNAIFIVVFLLFIAALSVTMMPKRSAYQPHMRIRLRNAGVKIIAPVPSHKNMDIIGDGAWSTTKAQYPESTLIRDMKEPRGA